jgi:hypothetical protein
MGASKKRSSKTASAATPEEAAPAAPDATAGAAAAPVPAAPETTGKNVIEVKYKERGEVHTREFSREVHGPDFKKLADEFKETNAARIVA